MAQQASLVLRSLLASASVALRCLPIPAAMRLMGYVTSLKPIRNVVLKTAVMERNLSMAFPDFNQTAIEALVKDISANMGQLIAEIIHIRAFRDGKCGTSLKVSSLAGETFDSANSAIFVGAHVGSWELLPLAFKDNARHLTVIYTEDKNPVIGGFLSSLRPQTGGSYVEKAKSVKACFTALEKGGSVALLIDQRVKTGLEVNLFGRASLISRLPASLAIRYSRPIIPFEVIRLALGEVEVVFHAPITPDGHIGKAGEIEITQQMTAVVQEIITRNRSTWFCNKRRWPRPKEGPAPVVSDLDLEQS